MDRSSTFRRVWGRYRAPGANQHAPLSKSPAQPSSSSTSSSTLPFPTPLPTPSAAPPQAAAPAAAPAPGAPAPSTTSTTSTSTSTGAPQPSQAVRSTPLGTSCSELIGHGAPRPGLRMSLRLRFFPQSGYVPVPARGSQLGGFRVLPRYALLRRAYTKLVWGFAPNSPGEWSQGQGNWQIQILMSATATTDDPKRHSTTPHRPPGGSPAAARRKPSGRQAAARRPLSALHQPIVDSDLSKATSRPRSSMALGLTHAGAGAPGWACNRENMGERRTHAERPRPTASHD
jgi:hypothetical protein